MTDSIAVFPPGARFLDASGNILAGGSVEFYLAGTTSPYTVYADANLSTTLGYIIHLDAGGSPVADAGSSTKIQIYVGIDPYKIVIKNSAGVVQETKDNISGALDTDSIVGSLTLIPQTVVQVLTAAEVLQSDDRGTLFNCNPTGGMFAVTLPDATVTPNGSRYGIRMAGSANAVTIKTTGGQSIARAGIISTSFALSQFGETVWLVNDGGNWVEDTYVPPLHNTVGVIAIGERLSTPPGSPVAGVRHIVTSGPTGAWSSYAEHDIVEADGNGGWFRYTPATDCGWITYVQDEGAYYWFVGSAWVQQTASSTVAGTIKVSSRSTMETGTATDAAVVIGHQHFHPAHPKAWGVVTVSGGTPTLRDSYNIAGITDTAQGRLTVTIDNDMANTNYAVVPGVESPNETSARMVSVSQGTLSAGSFELCCKADDVSGTVDPASWSFVVFGEVSP